MQGQQMLGLIMLKLKVRDRFFPGISAFYWTVNVHHHLTDRLSKPGLSAMLHSIKEIGFEVSHGTVDPLAEKQV